MSRVGKKPIEIPEGVDLKIEGQTVIVKGPKGELKKEFPSVLKIEIEDKKIFVKTQSELKEMKALWGTSRAILANMVKGVKEGFEKKLEIEGLGYRANLEGNNLVLFLGFSHPVKFACPEGIKFLVEKNIITVSGIDKELVGKVAAEIRKIKPPEPYKGKGIKYLGEIIRRKMGKKAVATK